MSPAVGLGCVLYLLVAGAISVSLAGDCWDPHGRSDLGYRSRLVRAVAFELVFLVLFGAGQLLLVWGGDALPSALFPVALGLVSIPFVSLRVGVLRPLLGYPETVLDGAGSGRSLLRVGVLGTLAPLLCGLVAGVSALLLIGR